ncbi:MAG: enoyl-CoA hydratase/isomerase family protein [Polyangiaceae bacterium]|nr:enoyl-CoA hydratase/isomerase family protein [Polyangiaceae bacterium]
MIEVVLRGPGKNALSTELMSRTLDAVRASNGAPLLLRGDGDAFSAGLDLKEVGGLDAPGMDKYLTLLDDLVVALFEHRGPTVACINGHAIAGGCVLALTCDHRVATTAEKARIGLNEVAIGLHFPPRILQLARVRLGPLVERQVLLEAGLFGPVEAKNLGLCDEIAEDPLSVARARLEKMAAHPRDAFESTKAAIVRGALDLDPDEMRRYRDEVLPRWTRPEIKEKIRAVLGR